MTGILYVFGLVLAALAGLMTLPSLVAAAHGEDELVPTFLISAAVTAFVAGGFIFALQGRERRLKRMEALILSAMLWTLLPVFIAVPLYLSRFAATPFDAYFEAVAGFTTSGASLLVNYETVPRAALVWRSMIEWLGGATTLLMLLLVFAPAHIGGTPDRPLRMVETGAATARRRIIGTGLRILPIYAGATLACFIALALAGVPALEALCLAFSTLSTGGFSPTGRSLEAYGSLGVEATVGLFMFVGATSIVWQRAVILRRWPALREHRESYWMAALVLVISLFFARGFFTGADGGMGLAPASAVWSGLISSISLVSTTGLEIRQGGFAAIGLPFLLALALIGGCGFSTAGGVKLFRLGAMMAQGQRELHRLVHPHGVRSTRIGSHEYDIQMLKAVWTGFLAFVGATVAGTMALTLTGVGFEAGITATVTSLSNAGTVYSSLAAGNEEWISFAGMGPVVRVVLIAAMVLGRLEVLAALALLNLFFWRS